MADAAGNIYVTGATTALDFPTANPIQGQRGDGGDGDAFVTKLNATGTALVYSTYLGGGGREEGNGLAVDPAGNAYVVGTTLSTDFPTANPLQATHIGSIYKSADGGNSWTASHNGLPAVNIRALAISRTNPAVLYAGSDRLPDGGSNKLPAGGVYKSADGGSNWKAVNTGLPPDSQVKALAVDPTNAAVVYAGVYNSTAGLVGVYKSADGGGSWRPTGLRDDGAALAIDPNNPATVYAAGISFVAKSTDGGDSWRINSAGFNGSVTALGIDPTNPTKVYAGDRQSNFYKSADGGATWSLSNTCLRHPVNALAIDPRTPTTLYLGTTDFETPHIFGDSVYKSADGGDSWCAVRAYLPKHRVYALAIDPSTPATLYAGAYDGVFKSTTGGDNWSATRSGLPDTQVNALVVDPASPTTLYAGLRGNADVFVAKLSASGSALVYSTYLGGSADDQGRGIAVDTEGNAYLTGTTVSLDFPTTSGAFQPVGNVNHFGYGCDNCLVSDAFIVKLNATGTALVYSTYFGGGGPERGSAIALDAAGNAYVAGDPDAFVTKINAAGSALAYSTQLNSGDVKGLAVDSAGNAFVVTTVSILDVYTLLIQKEVNVTKLNVTGTARDYSIYLGGSGDDYGAGIAVDSRGNAYVTGVTLSADFPTSPGAFQTGPGIFLTKLNGTGKALFYSTTINGSYSGGVALDAVGNVYLAGEDSSSAFIAKIDLSDNRASGETLKNVSAASFLSAPRILASESIVAAFDSNLATASLANSGFPLPTALAGTTVTVRDRAGTERLAPLFFVSPSQVNYQVPPGTQTGNVTVLVTNSSGVFSFESVGIASVQPGLFAANGDGQGAAAAVALRIKANGAQSYEPVARFDPASSRFVAAPIDLGAETDQVFLVLYGTGWRFRSSESAVNVRIGGISFPVLYAGSQPTFVGLDQINALLPRTLIGSGEVDVVVTVDGKTANTVKVHIK